jgi:hypothetical protein
MSPPTETKRKARSAPASRIESPRPEEYFAAVRDVNPFASNRITEPSLYDVDVKGIHAVEFDRLTDLATKTLDAKAGIGAALLGGAGVGKSHLLSRLYRWANAPSKSGGPRACYVYINSILADPDRLPRYLLKYVISLLTEGGQGHLHKTPLYRFVERALLHGIKVKGAQLDDAKAVHKAYQDYLSSYPEGRETFEVLYQFLRHARAEKASDLSRRFLASQAIAWLSGDEVDGDTARTFGLNVKDDSPVMLRDDEDVRRVLNVLARLAHLSRQPLILCIDQVENLDSDKLGPLSRFLHAILDRTRNLLIITSGVKESLLKSREEDVISEAQWDRIAEYKIELARVRTSDARKILEARLERFHEKFLGLETVRRHVHQDTLFPLGQDWLNSRFKDALEVRPRDILTWARDAWADQQSALTRLDGEKWIHDWPERISPTPLPVTKPKIPHTDTNAAIDEVTDRKINERIAQHRLQPGSLPPDAGNLAGLVESLLRQCLGNGLPYTLRGVERTKKKGSKLPPYDLLVREHRDHDGREVTTGVLLVTSVGQSATAALKRLLEDSKPPDHRLLVTDHERRPLKVGAQGVEYYRNLENLGTERFQHVKINFEQYAVLDALLGVVGMARSGDLEIESPPGTPRPVTDTEVVASHHRKDRYRSHALLRPLLSEEPPAQTTDKKPATIKVDAKAVRQHIMAQLAWMMGSTAMAVTKSYVEITKVVALTQEIAWPQVKVIAEQMHAEGLIHATPHDDDLFLLLRK